MDQKLRTERRKLADLKAAEYNPRKALTPDDAEYQKIRRSIEEFGYVDPIIINEDGTIIGGHQRATVLKDLGYQEVDVVVVALDKQREKALNIALNKITGEWDEVKLKDLLLDLDLGDYDISLTGFEQNDLTELVDKLAIEPEAVDDDFNEDEALEQAEAEPVTKLGDVWLLGRHRLMCGDSTSQDDMAVLMNGEIADLVVTDPPYNVNYGDKAEMLDEYLPAKGHRNINHIKNDNMDNQSFYSFLLATYQSAYEFMRAGAAIYVFHAESTGHIFRQAFLDAGLKLAQCLIWEKNAFVLGRQDYQWRHEPCLYGWKEGAAHYFINDRTQDTVILEDDIDFSAMKKNELVAYLEELRRKNRDQTSVIYENKPTRNDIHPTMKPIALVGKFITNSSKSGWNVLDLFGGSGSTLMAAEQLGRTAFIMELDERFCDVIVKRWEDYTGQQAVRIPAEEQQGGFYRVEVIASLFGVTVRRVQQLTQEGIISTTKTKEGNRYELAPTIQRYVKYLSDKAYGKSKSEKEAELREQKLQAEIALKESQGEMHRLKTEIASGKYIDIEEVKMDYSRFFVSFKKFALSLPSRLSGRISGHCDPMEIRSIEKDLNAEIIRLLNSFVVAGCTPEEMEKKKRGKKSVS